MMQMSEVISNNLNPVWEADNRFTLCGRLVSESLTIVEFGMFELSVQVLDSFNNSHAHAHARTHTQRRGDTHTMLFELIAHRTVTEEDKLLELEVKNSQLGHQSYFGELTVISCTLQLRGSFCCEASTFSSLGVSFSWTVQEPLVASLLLVAMPFATSSVLAPSWTVQDN